MILPPAEFVSTTDCQYLRLNGMDPRSFRNDGAFLVSIAMLTNLEENGPTRNFLDSALIADAIERPTVILEGLRRLN